MLAYRRVGSMTSRLTIEVKNPVQPDKTRRFAAIMLGYITADALWEGGAAVNKTARRPVYLALGGPETTLRPFIYNMKSGRKAALTNDINTSSFDRDANWVETLKTGGYETIWQRGQESHICTMLMPELFAIDPGMIEPERCAFASVAPNWWADAQMKVIAADHNLCGRIFRHAKAIGLMGDSNKRLIPIPTSWNEDIILDLLPQAGHFYLMLDKRTRRPLINDLAFAVQLYAAALHHGLASFWRAPGQSIYGEMWGYSKAAWAAGFVADNPQLLGFRQGVLLATSQNNLDGFLANQIRLYREVTNG